MGRPPVADAYKKDDKDTPKPRAGTGRLGGTGQLNMDSFASSGTSPLNRAVGGSTRRLSTGSIDVDRMLGAMSTELENGNVIVGKLESRIAVLKRALAIVERPNDTNQILQGVTPGEANFTKQVATMLQRDPSTQRRVQVATYQFDQAQKGLQQAAEVMTRAEEFDGLAKSQYVEANCQVEKLRGQLYPLINLHVVFKDNPLLAQLIPTPKVANTPAPQPQQQAAPQPQAPAKPAPTGALADPAVAQMVESITKMTGNLKDMFFKKK